MRSGLALGLWLPLAALMQAAALPLLFLDTAAAPVLPVAVLAAWATGARRRAPQYGRTWPDAEPIPHAAWLALCPAALILGWLSADTVGAVLLALLPAAGLLGLVRAPGGSLPAVLGAAATVSGGGAVLYHGTLLLIGGGEVLTAAPALVASAMWTGALAGGGALLLAPWRRRPVGGLFA